jgi:hypothetical protein
MHRTITALLLTGTICVGVPALADDSPNTSNPPPSATTNMHHQMMKDCMAKAKASNNGMSELDMKKSCKDQIKAKVDHPDDTSPPVTPAQ